MRTVFHCIVVDPVCRAQPVQRGERHAVELRNHDVEPCGALAVEGLAQVEQCQLRVVAGLGQAQLVFGHERLAFVPGRFRLFAGGDQFATLRGLQGAQGELAFGNVGEFLVVKYLQVECHDVDRHVFAGTFQILHGCGQVEFAAFDLAVDAHALEYGEAGRDVERTRGLVVVLVSIVAREYAAERCVASDRGVQVGQAAVFGRREFHLVLFDLQGALLHVDVVGQGITDAVVERPGRAGCRCCGGLRCSRCGLGLRGHCAESSGSCTESGE